MTNKSAVEIIVKRAYKFGGIWNTALEQLLHTDMLNATHKAQVFNFFDGTYLLQPESSILSPSVNILKSDLKTLRWTKEQKLKPLW